MNMTSTPHVSICDSKCVTLLYLTNVKKILVAFVLRTMILHCYIYECIVLYSFQPTDLMIIFSNLFVLCNFKSCHTTETLLVEVVDNVLLDMDLDSTSVLFFLDPCTGF